MTLHKSHQNIKIDLEFELDHISMFKSSITFFEVEGTVLPSPLVEIFKKCLYEKVFVSEVVFSF